MALWPVSPDLLHSCNLSFIPIYPEDNGGHYVTMGATDQPSAVHMSLVYGCTAVDFISGPQQMIDLMHRMSSSLPAVVDVTWLHSSQNGPVGLDPWGKFRWGRVIVCWLVAGANDRFVQKRMLSSLDELHVGISERRRSSLTL